MNYLKNILEIFIISTRLGLTSLAGPSAHLGCFHAEYVDRKKWIDEKSYAGLVALAQLLPGRASSQVGSTIGVMRGRVLRGLSSFLGLTYPCIHAPFMFPSVLVLIIFASLMSTINVGDASWIQGLKIVAVVIVLHAVLGMAKNLTPDIHRKCIALFAVIILLVFPSVLSQVGVIVIAA